MTDFITLLHRTIKGTSALILLGVGVFDTYLSWMYSYKWLAYIGSGTFISGLFAFILVVFAIISFEYAVLSLKKKRNKFFIGFLFLFWAMLALYSMQSTVASQYIDFMDAEYERKQEIAEDVQRTRSLEQLERRIQDKKDRISSLQVRINEYRKVLQNIESIEQMGTWRTTVKQNEERIQNLEEQIRAYEQDIRELENRKDNLLNEGIALEEETLTRNVFQFYEDLFNLNPNRIQFFLAVFKAVVLDLINILCFLFLTLEYVREQKEEQLGTVISEPIEDKEEPKPYKGKEILSYKQAVIMFIEETFKRIEKNNIHKVIGYAALNKKAKCKRSFYDRIIKIALSKGLIYPIYQSYMVKENVNKKDFYNAFFS